MLLLEVVEPVAFDAQVVCVAQCLRGAVTGRVRSTPGLPFPAPGTPVNMIARPLGKRVSAGASSGHLIAMGSEELQMMKLPYCRLTLTGSEEECRREVVGFRLETVERLGIKKNYFFHATQLLDAAGIWSTNCSFRRLTVTSMAALFVSLKLSNDHMRVLGLDPLHVLGDQLTRFLDGTAHQGLVSPEAIAAREHELLISLSFVVSAPSVSDWIEVLFRRLEVTSAGRWTRLHRFAAETAKYWSEILLLQKNLSEENSSSDVAFNMWCLSLCYSYWLTAVVLGR